ncbi:MAG: hypothetical protein FWH29_02825 [Methanobrevibacter sp.]|nr:hypothetical protein [Methanobrevibacter sp.]
MNNNSAGTDYGGAVYQNSATGGTLVVDNSTLSNNTAVDSGGSIYSKANNVSITNNSTLSNNTASNGSGGAVYHDGAGVLDVVGSVLNNNTAGVSGGGIYSESNETSIINSNLNNNSAGTDYGGAVYQNSATGGTLVVDNSTLSNNTADVSGGSIYSNADNVSITDNSILSNNTASNGSGGAVYHNGTGTLDVVDSILNNNTAGVSGGAIYSESNETSIINSNLNNNTASTDNGGAIYQNSSTGGTLNVSESVLNGNTASVSGGAIYSNAEETTIFGSTMSNNAANTGTGGAIHQESPNSGFLDVSDSDFDNNFAGIDGGSIRSNAENNYFNHVNVTNSDAGVNGGGIYHDGNGTLSIVNESNVTGNFANKSGGGVYSDTATLVIVDNSTIKGNFANAGNGGGIHYGNNGTLNINNSIISDNTALNTSATQDGRGGGVWTNASDVIVDHSHFINNTAGRNGGGIYYVEDGNFNITNTTFANNTAGINGGGIYSNTTNFTIIGSYFYDNEAKTNNGGGIHYHNPDGTLDVTGLIFIGNIAGENGGGVWTNATTVIVNHNLFSSNHAGNQGGAIYYTEEGNFTVENTNFTYNTAGNYGGGIFTNTTNFTVTGSIFIGNTAGIDGGGVHYDNSEGMFNITDLTFSGNTAGEKGGGVYTNVKNFYVIDSRFYGNGAAYGGGIYFYGDTLNVTNTTYRGNTATINGGGLWTDSGSIDILLSEFVANYAGQDGGAIYQNNSTSVSYLNIIDSLLSDNYARRDGGAVWSNGNNVTINNSTLKSNTAGRFGGAYYNTNGLSNLLIGQSILNFNYANQGGAVYTNALSSLITRSTLNSNYAYNTAGAVYQFGNGYLTIGHSNLTGNEAYFSAGALYTSVGTTVEYSNFTDSVAKNFYGGAIYNVDGELRVFFSDFIGNTAMVYGAAIYNYENCRLVVASSNFINNTGIKTSNKPNYGLVNIEDHVGAIANFGRAEITGSYFTGNALCIADYGNMFVTQSNFTNNRWALLLAGTNSHIFTNTFVNNNLFANVTTAGKENVINYNRIVVPFGGKALLNYGLNTDADYNWWGQNNFTNLIYGIELKNWFVMYIQTDIQPQNFVNPGQTLTYTYYFELNTKDPWNRNYLPVFYADINHNGTKHEQILATSGPRTWSAYFGTTDYFYATAILDHEVSSFNVNNYSTILKVDSLNARVGETVILTATLTDAYGTPMVYRKVSFYVYGVLIGSSFTNLDGVASLPYKVTSAGVFPVNAYFNGDKYTSGYYIVDPPLTGEGWYHATASVSGFLRVSDETIRIATRFNNGTVNASNANIVTVQGSRLSFTYTVRNLNASTVDLAVKFVIPAGLKIVKAVAYYQNGSVIRNSSISRFAFNNKTNTLTWYISASKEGYLTINITLKSSKAGKYTIKPVITSKDAKLNVSTGSIKIRVLKLPDLVITKVKKVKGTYRITVKNKGQVASSKTRLQLICGCKDYHRSVAIKSLAPGKSATYTLTFPYKGRNHVKYAVVNYNKKAVESIYKNNIYKVGKI